MVYTTIPTKSDTNDITAAEWNTYIRDNAAAGVPDIFEAAGDLAVGSGSRAAVRLPVGSPRAFLNANSAAAAGMEWRPKPKAMGIGPSSQTLNPLVSTRLDLAATVQAVGGMTVDLGNNTIVVPRTGRYTTIYRVGVARNVPYTTDDFPTNGYYVALYLNNILMNIWWRDGAPPRWNSMVWSGTISMNLTAGSSIFLYMVLNRSGYLGPLTISGVQLSCYLAE